jgi:hypothetical protein
VESLKLTLDGLPLWNWILQAAGLITSYIGAELNSRAKRSGFAVWISSNVILGTIHAASGLWLLLVLDVLYVRINVAGLRRWRTTAPSSAT